jgi:hypothetical protein
MMKQGLIRGVFIIFIVQAIWLTLTFFHYEGLEILLWLAPFIASITVSYSVSRKKFICGLSMSVVMGFSMIFNTIIYEAIGHTVEGYLYGIDALWAFFVLSLPVCAIGALVGIFLPKLYKKLQDI